MKRGTNPGQGRLPAALSSLTPAARLGLPQYPGIALFFVSAALSHHLFDIISHSDFEDLAAESLEALLIGVLATAITVALVARFRPAAGGELLDKLSVTLMPGILFVFAPFRYAQVCRWTDQCQYWSDMFLVLGAVLCALVGVYTWWDGLRRRIERWAAAAGRRLAGMPASRLFLLAWLLGTALLAWRGAGRLEHPELFAEGGRRFVADALNHGWLSLGFEYAGYYHVVPRLIALLVTATVPIAAVPAATTMISVAIAGAVSAFIARPAYRWLIPSDTVRVIAVLLLCLAPGLREVLGNLPNLHYLLFILLGLLALKDPDKPYRLWELGLAALVALSSGMAAALVPAIVLRAGTALARGHGGAGRELALAAVVGVPTLATGLLALAAGGAGAGGASLSDFSVATVISAWGTVATSSLLLHPLGGTVAVTEIMFTIPLWVLVLLALAVLAVLARRLIVRGHGRQAVYVGAWASGPFVLIVLLALARSPDLKMLVLEEHWRWYKWWMRYNYLFAASGVLLWLFLLKPARLLPGRSSASVLTLVLCAAYVSQANWYFDVPEYGEERRWARTSAALERAIETGCPRSVTVDIYPGNWTFTYYADKENPQCR